MLYINDVHILGYVGIGILGLIIGQIIDWMNIRLPEYQKIFSKDFFKEYLKHCKPKYILMFINAIAYIALLYRFGLSITTFKFMFLIPMLISSFVIDYRLQIIPNRITLSMFEVGLFFTLGEALLNIGSGINIFTDYLLGMIAGGGIFLLITLIGGFIAGKEAMGFGDVKLMGALGLFFGWKTIIMISVIAFLLAAIISIAVLILRRKKMDEYIPFGPFIVVGTFIAIYIPFEILIIVLLKIFSLGTFKG